LFSICRVHTFLPDAVMVLPTRVERPDEGGGWELLEDVYSKRIDFNQTGFTLHQVDESDPDVKTAGGSQPPGSQGPPSAAVEQSHAVDVEYTNIRCIKRGAKLCSCAQLASERSLFASFRNDRFPRHLDSRPEQAS